jgi:N-formylglutamate deformylase
MSPRFGARRRRLARRLLEARFPRAYHDPNRGLDDIDPDCSRPVAAPDSAKPQDDAGNRAVWRMARRRPDVRTQAHQAEVMATHRSLWRPYHDELDACSTRASSLRRGMAHQLPHRCRRSATRRADDPGRERAATSCWETARDRRANPGFTHLSPKRCATWVTPSPSTIRTKEWKSCRKHGGPAEGRHSLQLEVKRTSYMDEQTSRAQRRIPAPRGGLGPLDRDDRNAYSGTPVNRSVAPRRIPPVTSFRRRAIGKTT